MALSHPKLHVLVAAGLAFAVALGAFALLRGPSGSADTPVGASGSGSDGVGLLSAGQSTLTRIRVLQDTARAQPRNADVWAALGFAYYQRVRETGDFGFYTRADGVLRRALALQPRNESATIGSAIIALARHDFRGALGVAQRARALQPASTAWYPSLIDAQVELGRYDDAKRSIEQLIARKPNLASYARVSYFRELHGDLDGAASAMRLAISAGGDVPESIAYVQTLLGDIDFYRGRLSASQRAYRLALRGVPDYPLATAGLARAEAAAGKTGAAVRHFRAAIARLPLPLFVAELGETELAAGRGAAARSDFELVGAEERLLAANKVNTDVEIATFEADHGDPKRAVALGREAWRRAPSIRSADALGWALSRAGQPATGLIWARKALRLGSRYPRYLYHAGMTAKAAGQRTEARRYLHRLVSGTPHFSPLYSPHALRALKEVGG